jgi:hypothetical protein
MNKRYQHNLFLSLDSLVADDHPYHRLDQLISFSALSAPYANLYSTLKVAKKKALNSVCVPWFCNS